MLQLANQRIQETWHLVNPTIQQNWQQANPVLQQVSQLYYQSYNKTELTTSTFDTTTDITLTESNTTIGIIQLAITTTQ